MLNDSAICIISRDHHHLIPMSAQQYLSIQEAIVVEIRPILVTDAEPTQMDNELAAARLHDRQS